MALFFAQPENKKILETIAALSEGMSWNNAEYLIETLDKVTPFLEKLTVLRNKPDSLSRVLLEAFDYISKNRPAITNNSDWSLIKNLCKLVDDEITTIGPIRIIKQALQEDKDIVSVLWYPKGWGKFYTHTQVLYKGKVYEARRPMMLIPTIRPKFFFNSGDYELIEKMALTVKDKGFFKIDLAVSSEDMENIGNVIEGMSESKRNCIQTTNKIISESTNISIPFPLSQSPALTAKYLMILEKLGYKRIAGVQYVGREELKVIFSSQFFWELGAVSAGTAAIGGAIYAIIYFVTKDDEVEALLIEHKVKDDPGE